MTQLVQIRGRGAAENPTSRFERLTVVPDEEAAKLDDPAPRTRFFVDPSRSVITRNDSPDVGFQFSVNPYRGCEHGCIYCYARPTHEYLGWSAGLDFETRILVKSEAPALLRQELSSPRWTPAAVGLSGVTDPYQPAERRLGLTRSCLEVFAEFRNPVVVITKNHAVTRDSDLLGQLAEHGGAAVFLSVTTLDPELQRRMEPRTSTPERRLDAIRLLAGAGIPVGVNVAPVVPGLTDHELPAVLQAAAEAGARWAGYVPLRLPGAVAELFGAWLERHYPDRRAKVLGRVRDMRGGKLNDPRFRTRMRGEGPYADGIRSFFHTSARRAGLNAEPLRLRTDAFRRPDATGQLGLFDI